MLKATFNWTRDQIFGKPRLEKRTVKKQSHMQQLLVTTGLCAQLQADNPSSNFDKQHAGRKLRFHWFVHFLI
jgi:hypothetical protein